MHRLLFPLLLMLPSLVRADCVAFLVPPTARVTNDEAATTPWREGRQEYVVMFAAGSAWSSPPDTALIDKSAFDATFAACNPKSFIVSKKTGLLKLWAKDGDGFKAVWAKRDGLIEFSFPPDDSANAPSRAAANRAAAAHAAELELGRVRSARFKPPEVENERIFAADFDAAWAAMIEALSDQKWQVEIIDKGSGLVTTKPAVDSGGTSMVCAAKLDGPHKTLLNVFVKKVDAGTRVRVNAAFQAIREDQPITCSSNGTLEKALFEAIEKNLKGH